MASTPKPSARTCRRRGHLAPAVGIAGQRGQRGSEGAHLSSRHQDSRFSIRDQFRHAAHRGRHHRQPGRHGLHHRQRTAFPMRGQGEQVAGGEHAGDVGAALRENAPAPATPRCTAHSRAASRRLPSPASNKRPRDASIDATANASISPAGSSAAPAVPRGRSEIVFREAILAPPLPPCTGPAECLEIDAVGDGRRRLRAIPLAERAAHLLAYRHRGHRRPESRAVNQSTGQIDLFRRQIVHRMDHRAGARGHTRRQAVPKHVGMRVYDRGPERAHQAEQAAPPCAGPIPGACPGARSRRRPPPAPAPIHRGRHRTGTPRRSRSGADPAGTPAIPPYARRRRASGSPAPPAPGSSLGCPRRPASPGPTPS